MILWAIAWCMIVGIFYKPNSNRMRTFEVALRVVKATLCSNLCALLYQLSVLKPQDQGRIQGEQMTLPLHSSLSMSCGQVC